MPTLINVDIQPEYKDSIYFDLQDWTEDLNNYDGTLIFLYNGEDTLGMINESDYQIWLMEHGLEEETINRAIFYDKGYAFFRYCMDEYVDEDEIVNLVKFMINKNVNDSRDMTEEFWQEFIAQYNGESITELLEVSDDCIWIPDLMEFLQNYDNITICGGGANECLKEVEIALQSLNKPYNTKREYIYESMKKLTEQINRTRKLMGLNEETSAWGWESGVERGKANPLFEDDTNEIIAYHGSDHNIKQFVDDFVGGIDANDAEGPGIYFANTPELANQYGKNVYKVILRPRRLLRKEKVKPNIPELTKLIKMANDWEGHAQNWDPDINRGFEVSLKDGIIDYNDSIEKDMYLQVWIEYYRGVPKEYTRNCVSLGIDGLTVNLDDRPDVIHYIIYNPGIIEFVKKVR